MPLGPSSMLTPKPTRAMAMMKLPTAIMVFLPRKFRRIRPTQAQAKETPPTSALIYLIDRSKLSLRIVLE